MNDAITDALTRDRTIDITTTGRRSGRPQRIEDDIEAWVSDSPIVEVEFLDDAA